MGIAATIAIEIAILLVLLTLGTGIAPSRPETVTLTSFDASEPSTNNAEEETPEETPEENPQEAETPAPQAIERPAPDAVSIPLPPTALPRPSATPAPVTPPVAEPQPSASPSPPSRIRAVIRQGANVGPPDTGRPGPPDTQVVGTAPDGSPLYAAQWYREPYDSEIAGYLSTARSPGWGMIACKTAPQWRVEECVVVGESPNGSGIARATLAAAWQFLVRPPRLDGEYQVGAWVRIRMNYSNGRGPGG